MAMFKDGDYLLNLSINATDLAAGTTQYVSSPCDGFIEEFETVTQEAIGTGGVLKLTLGSTDVVGATVTLANSEAVGTVHNAKPALAAATAKVTKGQAIKVSVDAAFATTGAVRAWIRITGAKV